MIRSVLRLTTANLFNYGRYTDRPEWRRQQEGQLLGLRKIAPDVLCVQEFWHQARDLRQDPVAPELVAAWAEFCQALGMHGRLAPARSHHHVGVLWRPDRARLLAWQDYSHWSALHHALGVAVLDLGVGGPWRVAAVHLNPADPVARYIEAGYVASAGLGAPWRPTLLGGDFNAAGAEPALDSAGDEGGFYDPEPYREQEPGSPHQHHQVLRDDDPAAPPRLDRRALERLRRAGLVDVAWHLRVPWAPTTGYHSDDPHGDRRGRRRGRGRPDGWRASAAALPHITDYWVEEDIGSDHRPATITLDLPESLR